MFQWMYWHVLLPGRDIPGISPQMQMARQEGPPRPTVSTERTDR